MLDRCPPIVMVAWIVGLVALVGWLDAEGAHWAWTVLVCVAGAIPSVVGMATTEHPELMAPDPRSSGLGPADYRMDDPYR